MLKNIFFLAALLFIFSTPSAAMMSPDTTPCPPEKLVSNEETFALMLNHALIDGSVNLTQCQEFARRFNNGTIAEKNQVAIELHSKVMTRALEISLDIDSYW